MPLVASTEMKLVLLFLGLALLQPVPCCKHQMSEDELRFLAGQQVIRGLRQWIHHHAGQLGDYSPPGSALSIREQHEYARLFMIYAKPKRLTLDLEDIKQLVTDYIGRQEVFAGYVREEMVGFEKMSSKLILNEMENLFKLYDADGDAELSLEEYFELIRGVVEKKPISAFMTLQTYYSRFVYIGILL